MLDSEKESAFLPLGIHNVSVSPASSSHVFAVLDTVSQADVKGVQQGLYGKDVMVWGGNGKHHVLFALIRSRLSTWKRETIQSRGPSTSPSSHQQAHRRRR